jgi:hypothetical protein
MPIAALTVLSAVLQGYENQRTHEDINTKHAQAISQIQTTQNDISTKHAEAMRELAQARGEAANQHTEALREIDQARKEAARQYDEAAQEIKKTRDEALLLIKWVPRLWIFIYSVSDKLVTPTVLKWIRRRSHR